jgi:hypothetical protein
MIPTETSQEGSVESAPRILFRKAVLHRDYLLAPVDNGDGTFGLWAVHSSETNLGATPIAVGQAVEAMQAGRQLVDLWINQMDSSEEVLAAGAALQVEALIVS